jgi:hypothetical protein
MTGDALTDFPEAVIRRELEAICLSPTFARSPVMLRLLRYLVDQSLAGAGHRLKSYSVAVEGLGRDSDFDAMSDSYPRVQAGRLRRLLELHYHRLGDDGRPVRLRIASIGYAVVVADTPPHIDKPAAHGSDAADALVQPVVVEGAEPAAAPDSQKNPERPMPLTHGAAQPGGATRGSRHRYLAAIAAVLAMAGVAFAIYAVAWPKPVSSQIAPTLQVDVRGSVDAARKEELRGWLMASLQPSWVYRLTDNAAVQSTMSDATARQPVSRYLLTANIVPRGSARTIQLILSNAADGQIYWTQIIDVGAEGETLAPLEPAITKLSSPAGVIATAELTRYGPSRLGNYGCTLLAERYLRLFAADVRSRLNECVARGLRANPDDAKLLVARALTQYNRADRLSDLSAVSMRRSYADVQRAAEIAPLDPSVALIQSRYMFLRGDCARGTVRAQQAIDAWPLLARSWGLTGFFLFDCGDPRAIDFVNRARELQGATTSLYESVRVFDALERHDLATANQIAAQLNPEDRASDLYQRFTDVVLAAANRRPNAWRLWTDFAAGADSEPTDADAVLRRYGVGARHRRIALRILEPLIAEQATNGT